MPLPKAGLIGFLARNNIFYKSTLGPHKEEEPTCRLSSSRWYPPSQPPHGKKRPAYWEQLQVRFQCAQQQPPPRRGGPTKGFAQAIQDPHKHWTGTPTWGQLLDTCHHWQKHRDPHAATLIQHTIAHQQQAAQEAAHDEAHLQYKEWLLQGQAKGLRGLFRNLKSSEIAWERPYRDVPQPQRMDRRLQDWGHLWDIRQDNLPHPRPSIQTQAQASATTAANHHWPPCQGP